MAVSDSRTERSPLGCPTCRTNLGTYSPRTLGRRAERGETLLLPYG